MPTKRPRKLAMGMNEFKCRSGRMKVVMDDDSEEEFGPGNIGVIPPGHNAWIVGEEKFVAIDFTGMKTYAKNS